MIEAGVVQVVEIWHHGELIARLKIGPFKSIEFCADQVSFIGRPDLVESMPDGTLR